MSKTCVGNLPFSAPESQVRELYLNGKDFSGRPLRVNEAQERKGDPARR